MKGGDGGIGQQKNMESKRLLCEDTKARYLTFSSTERKAITQSLARTRSSLDAYLFNQKPSARRITVANASISTHLSHRIALSTNPVPATGSGGHDGWVWYSIYMCVHIGISISIKEPGNEGPYLPFPRRVGFG